MKRSRWVLLGLVVVLAAAGAALAVWRWKAKQPAGEARYGGKSAAVWIEALAEADPFVAAGTISELRALGDSALPVLLEARKSVDLRVHRRAVALLVALGASAVDPLVEALPHGGARVEVALVRLGPAAVPGLEKALSGKDGASAARVLGLIGSRASPAVPALVGLVQDGASLTATRVAAVRALGRIGAELGPEVLAREDDPIVPSLTAALASDDLRLPAAQALASLGPSAQSAIADLARLAREKDASLAAAACHALGRTGAPAAATPLVAQLARTDRAAPVAALALARLGPAARPALPAVIAALKSKKGEGQLARAVLERLGELVVPDLQEALANPDADIRRAAAEVLGLLGPRARGAAGALAAHTADEKPAVALHCLRALTHVDLPNANQTVAPLGKLLAHNDAAIASAAAFVLADLGSMAAPLVPDLLAMLAGKDDKRAARAAALLGGILPPAKGVVEALAAGLSRSAVVRLACIQSLGRLREASKGALPALRKILDDQALRPDAALAIMRISPDDSSLVAEKLSADLADKEPACLAALVALAEMEPPPVEILPALRPLLGNFRLGRQALLVLSRMDRVARTRVIPDLLTLLGSNDLALQSGAAHLLRRMGTLAGPGLVQALKSQRDRTRIGAMMALHAALRTVVKDRKPLLDALEGTDLVLREQAARALLSLGVGEADLPRVREWLARPEADLRRVAVQVLGAEALGRPGLDESLRECLLDPDEGVRDRAAAVGWPKGAPPPEQLIAATHDGSLAVATTAALNLQGTGEEVSGTLLMLARVVEGELLFEMAELLDKKNAALVKALKPSLQAALRGDELGHRLRAGKWLSSHDTQQEPAFTRFLESVLLGWDAGARLEAATVLASLRPGPRSALPTLLHRRAVEPDRDVRDALGKAIEAIKP